MFKKIEKKFGNQQKNYSVDSDDGALIRKSWFAKKRGAARESAIDKLISTQDILKGAINKARNAAEDVSYQINNSRLSEKIKDFFSHACK